MEILDYLKKIEKEGYEAYIVGGYVRDKLLGIDSSDIDITTSAPPKVIANIFELSQSDELGCINIKEANLNIDITTFRRESNYYKHRPKKVVYVKDLYTDLKRRDFTINTICMNSNGDIIDLLGGRSDLNNKLIKVVGNVKKKFSEDPLRMLRAMRFSITFDLRLGDEELSYIINNKNLLKQISYERRKEELIKIFISKNCVKGLQFLKNLNILNILDIDYVDDIKYVPDYLGIYAQMSFSDKYPFSKIENLRVKNIKAILKYGKIDKNILFHYGIYDSLICASILNIDADYINNMYKSMNIHSKEELAISGKRIKELLGIDDSPIIKKVKRDLICELVSGNLTNEENILEEYILNKWK